VCLTWRVLHRDPIATARIVTEWDILSRRVNVDERDPRAASRSAGMTSRPRALWWVMNGCPSLAWKVGGLALLCGVVYLWYTRSEISTMAICADGQVCTDYFYLKDGLPVRTVCPSKGGEEYPLPKSCTRSGGECHCTR
jgi:hypothetical protein